jgi:hypothetical protein
MKRTLLVVSIATGALAAAGIAWSSGVLGGGPAQIRVYGGGQVATPTAVARTLGLDAYASPQGLEAYGSLRYAGVPPGFRGELTCLSVAGDPALVGGFIRERPANLVGLDFLYGVTDNGPPGSGADQAGFIDVGPELDSPPIRACRRTFRGRVRQRRARRRTSAPTRSRVTSRSRRHRAGERAQATKRLPLRPTN